MIIEHFDPGESMKPNVPLNPGANIIIPNQSGCILLQKRSDGGQWFLPGGSIQHGESLIDGAKREVFEETGLKVEIVDLIGIYSSPDILVEYPNGNIRQNFTCLLLAQFFGGTLNSSSEETDELRWLPLREIFELNPRLKRIDQMLLDYQRFRGRPFICN